MKRYLASAVMKETEIKARPYLCVRLSKHKKEWKGRGGEGERKGKGRGRGRGGEGKGSGREEREVSLQVCWWSWELVYILGQKSMAIRTCKFLDKNLCSLEGAL